MKCEWLVPKLECKGYQNGKNHLSVRCETVFLCFLNIVHFAYARFCRVAVYTQKKQLNS